MNLEKFIHYLKQIIVLLKGNIQFKFSVLIVTSGVVLVSQGSFIELIFEATIEYFGLSRTQTDQENQDFIAQKIGVIFIAQKIGVIMIILGCVLFYTFLKNRRLEPNLRITSRIIDNWSKGKNLTDNQHEWLAENPKWAKMFWEITEQIHLSKKERLAKILTVRKKNL